jgi:hypothetical protein
MRALIDPYLATTPVADAPPTHAVAAGAADHIATG